MISDGSRDTEDWSNDAENSALPSQESHILNYIQIDFFLIILNNITVLLYF